MPECINFKIVDGEKRWTYPLRIRFNKKKIIEATITDHYQKEHPEITNELIMELLVKMDGEILKPIEYPDKNVYKWEKDYKGKRYRLIFWYNNNNSQGLWIRNCYPIDSIDRKIFKSKNE